MRRSILAVSALAVLTTLAAFAGGLQPPSAITACSDVQNVQVSWAHINGVKSYIVELAVTYNLDGQPTTRTFEFDANSTTLSVPLSVFEVQVLSVDVNGTLIASTIQPESIDSVAVESLRGPKTSGFSSPVTIGTCDSGQ